MPPSILDYVGRPVLQFITPICWAKLRVFSMVNEMYGIKGILQDRRMLNAAQLLQEGRARGLDNR